MRRGLTPALMLVLAYTGPALANAREGARAALGAGAQSFFDGNPRAARIELLNAIKADPDWALPHALQGRVYLALGDGAAAEAELQRAISDGMKASAVTHLLAHAYLLQGDPERALDMAGRPVAIPSARAYVHRVAARAAIAVGDFQRAAKELDAAFAITPGSSLLWSDIGRFRALSGNVGGAVEAAQRASALNPVNVEALLLMGQLVRGQYGLLAALPWFDKAVQIDPGNMEAMGQSAATLGEAGQATAMLALTRKMLAIDPDNVQAYYLQAVLAARAGNDNLARSLVYRIRGRMDSVPAMMLLQSVLEMRSGNAEQAIARLEDLSKAQPQNFTIRRLLGAAMLQSGDPRSAIAVLTPIARRADADSYTLSVIGRACEAVGDRVAAATYLDRAAQPLSSEPAAFEMLDGQAVSDFGESGNADVAIPRINRLVLKGELAAALAAAERLRDLNRGAPAAHVLVGDVLMMQGRSVDAANAYRVAANIQFSESTAMRLIAALQRSGQGAAALRVLNLFLSQNPRSVPGLRLASDYLMASGQWDRAIDMLENVRARIGNRDAAILSSLGWAWFNKGTAQTAVDYARAAYAIAPSNPAVANGYGWILYKTGTDRQGGVALLKKAVAIAPDRAEPRYQLAQGLAGLGLKAAAKAQLQAALAIPDFPNRTKAAELLSRL